MQAKLLSSKTEQLALLKTIQNSTVQELSKTQKDFLWKTHNPKIKHDNLSKNYENGDL